MTRSAIMSTFKATHWFFVAFLFSSCAGPSSSAQEKPANPTSSHETQDKGRPLSDPGRKQSNRYVEGQIIIKFMEGTTAEAIETLMRELNLELIRIFSSSNLYLMRICDSTPVKTILERLKKYPEVEHAEPNYAFSIE